MTKAGQESGDAILAPLPEQAITRDVLLEKYAKGSDQTANDVRLRIATALAKAESADEQATWTARFYQAQVDGFIPAGRIASAAGSGLQATLINCFVQPVGDSIDAIFGALHQAAQTMRRGGGVGYDFSPIRPAGALVQSTASHASGPVSYMHIFDRMCETVESAGARRGAQMAVLRCDHPDIEAFIQAKDRGELQNFNLSVACTDAFMQAVTDDAQWRLVHIAPPSEALIHAGAYRGQNQQWVYKSVAARALFDQIMRSTYDHAEPGVVFLDTVNRDNNLAWCETIAATNPCGEQPLPPFGCCDLGSINLTAFVQQPFSAEAGFDFARFKALIPLAVRMLDNALDVTLWPLPEQQEQAHSKRRIGLGFTGLADALIMLGLRFDSDPGRHEATRMARTLRDTAYAASVELARERGPFPMFDAQHYGGPGSAASRLPAQLRAQITRFGLRNSHLISIAPTGTISLAFADNASNGIEPAFSWTYQRTKRDRANGLQVYEVQDHAWRRYRHHAKLPADVRLVDYDPLAAHAPGEIFEANGQRLAMLPPAFVSALHISASDHARMSMAVQPFVDSAISKTVNVPLDYPFAEFSDLYMQAWRGGLKGLTTYRPNPLIGSVLSTGNEPTPLPAEPDTALLNQRLKLDHAPVASLATLRWPGRPNLQAGNPSWTYMVHHPLGNFAVFIGHIEAGAESNETAGTAPMRQQPAFPFEVWVNGAEQPRGLGALAKTLSMDMRANDPQWLDLKLRALEKAAGDDAFEMRMPPHGTATTMPSLVAGFARLLRYRCNELQVFDSLDHGGPNDSVRSSLISSLIGRREPKAGPDGTMSWTVDLLNPATGDDFALFLKELVMPDGQRRPYSIWLSGEYPRTFDGLCKALSIDMWVLDPAWTGMKLRKLLNYSEAAGAFRARVPGSDQSRLWPSTIAYLAQLVIHRYHLLGLLDETGHPLSGANEFNAEQAQSARLNRSLPGLRCAECGNRSVIRRDGCEFCTACGSLGACG